MSSSEAILKFCVYQDNLAEVLQGISDSLQGDGNVGKISRKMEKLGDRLSAELKRLHQALQDVGLNHLEIRPHWDAFAAQAKQLVQALTPDEAHRAEWAKSWAQLSARAAELRQDIEKIDLKSALNHVADAVLVDHYEQLGESQILQWPRKIWHILSGCLIVSIYLFVPATFSAKMTVFGFVTCSLLIGELFRLTLPNFNGRVMHWLRPYMRKREVSGCSSTTFFALSTFMACALFPKGIAIVSILYLTFGDSLASIVGIKWGKHKLGRRFSLEGTLTFFAVAFLITLLYPIWAPEFSGSIWLLALLGGIIGTASEWSSYRLDDNLVIPLFSATFLSLALHLL